VDLEALRAELGATPSLRPVGRVVAATGVLLRFVLPSARVGDLVRVKRPRGDLTAEIVGFDAEHALALPFGELTGVGPDDAVEATGGRFEIGVGAALVGRVLDGLGRPLDGLPPPDCRERALVDRDPPPALTRRPVNEPFTTGVRALDGLLTLGVGQRIGLFAGSGVGKSTLLGAIARGSNADVVVVALVGERGREVAEFLEHSLGSEGRKRAVVVVATSDAPPVERLRAVQVATTIAESFRTQGKSVLLLVDSITRVARAQREIGLAAGEPPARRGYPPSVFTLLPRLLERSGQGERGAITAVYTVLVEGGDLDEPVADEVRGILDGHVVLERSIAARAHYPAIDPLASISRVMERVALPEHVRAAQSVRALLAAYEEKRDLVTLGAYVPGSDARVDAAIVALPELERWLKQDATEIVPFARTVEELLALAHRYARTPAV
jgi:ATP synthase in type III secretion protein N